MQLAILGRLTVWSICIFVCAFTWAIHMVRHVRAAPVKLVMNYSNLFIDLLTCVPDIFWSADCMEYMYFCMLFHVVQSGFMQHASCLCNSDKPYVCLFI